MNAKRKFMIIFAILAALSIIAGVALAEDGLIFRRNVSKTPEGETEKAAIYMMDFYVPAQSSAGIVGPVDNYCLDGEEPTTNDDGTCVTNAYEPRDYAKPLISVYIDGIAWADYRDESDISIFGSNAIEGGITFGEFDAFVGVSLDDGTSWRTENLSRSADLSSFTLKNGHVYPGDVHAVVHQVAEDKIFVAWASKYCESGSPLYAIDPAVEATYLADLETTYGKDALYLYDLFGVAGNQGSVDYTEQGYPEIGEIPYSCIWTARGKLIAGDDPNTAEVAEASHVLWTKPERLTSGVRDANLPAVDCAKGAGCILTWQEDPEGLRPGQGLGPGEGWSGAIANAKTDIWYSYIDFADFDLVFSTDDPLTAVATPIEEYERTYLGTTMPKPYVPMAIPVRLTDNEMCRFDATQEDPFCWIDFDALDTVNSTNITTFLDGLTAPQAGADFCASSVAWTNPSNVTINLCVTEDGRVMQGRVASTRVRLALKPYTPADATDRDGDGVIDGSAWLSLAYEETKALGDQLIDPLGNPTEEPLDIGKDVWYHSFDMFNHDFVAQGGMLNQPARCSPWTIGDTFDCTDYEFFPVQTDPLNGGEFYLTEISRRFAMALNNISNITDPTVPTDPTESAESGLAGMLIYKQGIINQGGPADIMLRRLVVQPFCTDTDADGIVDDTVDCFDPAVDNPYAFENMECADDGDPNTQDGWLYKEDADVDGFGDNPNYLKGLCLSPAINISGSTIATCTEGAGNDTCASAFPVADDGSIPEDVTAFPKVLTWRQCDGVATIEGCEADNDLDDQIWENPYDVAKGHRGFLDGDFVMMMYAWAPNWKANSVGNDHYNLYVRRSFDGGATWTTTPADWCTDPAVTGTDAVCGSGVTALEYYYSEGTEGGIDPVPTIWEYAAGAFEQARNVSLLKGNKITILDPRYSPAGGLKQYNTIRTDWLTDTLNTPYLPTIETDDTLPYADDLARDSSKYMMIYETGDNTTVTEGEAVPLDLYYSRATVFGDQYEWFDYVSDELDGNPVDGVLDPTVEVEPRWPWLENKADDLSGEASVVLNPGGTFSYQVWNQWQEEITDEGEELIFDSDMIFRRLMYLTDLEAGTMDYMPTSTILYQSDFALERSLDQILTLIGTGRDFDQMNGNGWEDWEAKWLDDRGAILCEVEYAELETCLDKKPKDGVCDNGCVDLNKNLICDDKEYDVWTCEKEIQVRASDLAAGMHRIYFHVRDGEGNSSKFDIATVFVADRVYQLNLPQVAR
jgi:hypothetical protein